MTKENPHAYKTGTAIPLAALKTEACVGCGEFSDLMSFADFCVRSGLEIIQLLPVNDTGTDSSPYNALSAFALHPIYISISRLPEFNPSSAFGERLSALKNLYEDERRFNYTDLRREKLKLLKDIYLSCFESIEKDGRLADWIMENPWVQPYAVFMRLKDAHYEASWKEWDKKYRKPTPRAIQKLWDDEALRQEHLYFAWMQYRASQQFGEAADYIRSRGLMLKGDIPIMMNEDSCDAWAYTHFFNDDMRAGAPPDGMNPGGQNWGFPVYRWNQLKKDGYSWWKDRLRTASRYYDAYRIDHVLGFFRIWQIPSRELSARMGHADPDAFITRKSLHEAGFSDERIRWLSEPHVPTREIEAVNSHDYLGTHGILRTIMNRIGDEELWLFKEDIRGEKDIFALALPYPIREKLAYLWRNRTLRAAGKDSFSVQWCYTDSSSWQSLSEDERDSLGRLIENVQREREKKWEKQARDILGELVSATKMLPCAEDLGSNPASVPRVLADLGILGLRVVRWTRKWAEAGEPYVPFEDYPELSVAASSVHDSSTLRLWWLNREDNGVFAQAFPPPEGIVPGEYGPHTADWLLRCIARSASRFCIHPIQDFLSLCAEYYADNPQEERVNIPGQVNTFNWTYRLPTTVENMIAHRELTESIASIAGLHKETARGSRT